MKRFKFVNTINGTCEYQHFYFTPVFAISRGEGDSFMIYFGWLAWVLMYDVGLIEKGGKDA